MNSLPDAVFTAVDVRNAMPKRDGLSGNSGAPRFSADLIREVADNPSQWVFYGDLASRRHRCDLLPRTLYLFPANFALTNRVLTAREAQEWGLVTRVVPDAALAAEAQALAAQLAAGATRAFGAAKRLLHHSSSESLETQMELEAQAIAERSRGADAREGIDAFIAKRAPRFGGE